MGRASTVALSHSFDVSLSLSGLLDTCMKSIDRGEIKYRNKIVVRTQKDYCLLSFLLSEFNLNIMLLTFRSGAQVSRRNLAVMKTRLGDQAGGKFIQMREW